MRKATWLLLTAAIVLGSAAHATAAVPPLINYQGVLRDSTGAVVRDSAYSVTFRIYSTETSGSPLWEEQQTITTRSGLFNVLLGSVNPVMESHFAGDAYLEVEVDPSQLLTPRTRVASVGYAFQAGNAQRLAGLDVGQVLPTAHFEAAFRVVVPIPQDLVGPVTAFSAPPDTSIYITGIHYFGAKIIELRIAGELVLTMAPQLPASGSIVGHAQWNSGGGAPIVVEPNQLVEIVSLGGPTSYGSVLITGYEF